MLVVTYYCDWVLHRSPGSAEAVVDTAPPQTCNQRDDTTAITYTYHWSTNRFSLATTDGKIATIGGHVFGPFDASDRSTGTCDGTFSGELTKEPPP